jgi:hypothetical protein
MYNLHPPPTEIISYTRHCSWCPDTRITRLNARTRCDIQYGKMLRSSLVLRNDFAAALVNSALWRKEKNFLLPGSNGVTMWT